MIPPQGDFTRGHFASVSFRFGLEDTVDFRGREHLTASFRHYTPEEYEPVDGGMYWGYASPADLAADVLGDGFEEVAAVW